jgi:hypothetical protein
MYCVGFDVLTAVIMKIYIFAVLEEHVDSVIRVEE